jgi:hypothetical protein
MSTRASPISSAATSALLRYPHGQSIPGSCTAWQPQLTATAETICHSATSAIGISSRPDRRTAAASQDRAALALCRIALAATDDTESVHRTARSGRVRSAVHNRRRTKEVQRRQPLNRS